MRPFLQRHGITGTVAIRVSVVVVLLMAVGVRFERTYVALACSAVFLALFFLLNRGRD